MEVLKLFDSPLKFSHQLLDYHVVKGDKVIDATAGNGNDTVKLSSLVGKIGKVHGFDVQQQAIEETKKKLTLTGLAEQVELHHTGHENMGSVITQKESVAAVVFNLGYLPKGDKTITTLPDTTLKAIKQSLDLVQRGGILLIMVYHGHEEGKEEKDSILQFTQNLPQKEFGVLQYQFINQKNNPPFLIAIEKK